MNLSKMRRSGITQARGGDERGATSILLTSRSVRETKIEVGASEGDSRAESV
jgi:hypothetical protein